MDADRGDLACWMEVRTEKFLMDAGGVGEVSQTSKKRGERVRG